jgi:hypothetical protein
MENDRISWGSIIIFIVLFIMVIFVLYLASQRVAESGRAYEKCIELGYDHYEYSGNYYICTKIIDGEMKEYYLSSEDLEHGND